jgi:hypothetical protein
VHTGLSAFAKVVYKLKYAEFLCCAQHGIHTGYVSYFLWLELCIAAHHQHISIGVFAQGLLHRLTAFAVCIVSYTAGVDHIHICRLVKGHRFIPLLLELAVQGGGFAEIQLAAQCMEAYRWHKGGGICPFNLQIYAGMVRYGFWDEW